MTNTFVQAMWTPQGFDWLIILIVALLIFGRRLPDVARSLGKSLVEFKKGLNEAKEAKGDIENDVKKLKDDVVNQAKDTPDDFNKTT
ncbi:MAG: twin-arginine translocase TatA/TatE family subunit [Phycisphaerae bacterium]|nr:twin-arginine translocase TatA/TatE family subunit [Phycisphaerae bacterium]